MAGGHLRGVSSLATRVLARAASARPDISNIFLEEVWTRLTTQFPHMFAVAEAKRTLDSLNLDGTHSRDNTGCRHTIMQVTYKGWSVTLEDLQHYTAQADVRPSVFEMLLRLLVSAAAPPASTAYLANSYMLSSPVQKKDKDRAAYTSA